MAGKPHEATHYGSPSPSTQPYRLCSCCANSCGGLGGCSQESSSTAPASKQGKTTSAQTAPPTVKRDLKSFDVCARVPAAAVAGILASTPERITGEATMTAYASDCTYTIRRDEGAKDYAMVWLYAPEMWDPSAAGKIEKIGAWATLPIWRRRARAASRPSWFWSKVTSCLMRAPIHQSRRANWRSLR